MARKDMEMNFRTAKRKKKKEIKHEKGKLELDIGIKIRKIRIKEIAIQGNL